MKKLLAGLTIAAVAMLYGGPAMAASISNVSDSSVASVVSNWLTSLNLTNTNSAHIGNVVTSAASSGDNSMTSADDQTNVSITTGAANSASIVDNVANHNEVVTSVDASDTSGDTVNNIGDESTATVTNSDELHDSQTNANSVYNFNMVAAFTQTGGNSANSGDSQTGATFTTGLAQSGTGVTSTFNVNLKSITRTLRAF